MLQDAKVNIIQGDTVLEGFTFAAASRVPASSLLDYFSLPIPQALRLAADLNPSLSSYVRPDQPQLVIETCGWRMPGEPAPSGLSPTTSSVYLGVIRK